MGEIESAHDHTNEESVAYLDDVSRTPLTAPNVDMATNTGITHAIGPYSRSANV